MLKIISVLIVVLFFVSLTPDTSYAKTLPQAKTAGKVAVKQSVSTGGGISVTPRLRRDRKALFVYFGNLQNATSVSYALIYQTNGREEGAGGSVRSNEGNSVTRELLFGTCSKKVCTYHSGITNMRLEVASELKSGKKSLKRYKIKI